MGLKACALRRAGSNGCREPVGVANRHLRGREFGAVSSAHRRVATQAGCSAAVCSRRRRNPAPEPADPLARHASLCRSSRECEGCWESDHQDGRTPLGRGRTRSRCSGCTREPFPRQWRFTPGLHQSQSAMNRRSFSMTGSVPTLLLLVSVAMAQAPHLVFSHGVATDGQRWMNFVAISSDGRTVAADGNTPAGEAGALGLWTFPEGEYLRSIVGTPSAISSDFRYFATETGVQEVETGE